MSSLRTRVSLTMAAVVMLLVAVFALVVYLSMRRALWDELDRTLARRLHALAGSVERDAKGYELEFVELTPEFSAAERPAYFQLWGPDGRVSLRSPSLGGRDLPRVAGTPDAPAFRSVDLPDGRPGRLAGVQFVPRLETPGLPPAGIVTLVLADETATVEATLALLRSRLGAVGLLFLLLAVAAAILSVGGGLRPLAGLAARLETMDDRDLSVRLPVEGLPDELAAPVRKLNGLLARLEESFARERRFTSDVSHELRTPLAGLRSVLDVAALRDRTPDEYRAALARVDAIVAQMQTMVENLLTLAKVDHAQAPVALDTVGLRGLVDECWQPPAARAAARGLSFANEIPTDLRVTTDREKLRLVVGNLLANAAEYTAPGGRVTVRSGAGDGVLIDVCDSGPPIPDAELPRIFDRFWRGDRARSDAGVHCGIGLPLARALCGLLGHALTAANLPDGSVRFRIARAGGGGPAAGPPPR